MWLGFLITAGIAGALWVYVVPMVQAQVPASWQSSKVAQVGFAGLFILGTVWATVLVAKTFGGRKVV